MKGSRAATGLVPGVAERPGQKSGREDLTSPRAFVAQPWEVGEKREEQRRKGGMG